MKRIVRILFPLLGLLPCHAQVPVTPIVQPHVTFVDGAGSPCATCKLYTDAAGTTTPLATYADATGTSQNTNPIVLDAAGGANIWMGANSYKFILKDSSGATIWTVDQVNAAHLFPCGTAGAIQVANSGGNGTTCDQNVTINTVTHAINIGPSGNHVTIGPQGTPTSWTFDTTSPASALASLGWASIVYASNYTTLSQIETACNGVRCEVIVSTPQTFTLTADHTIPAGIRLSFVQSGEWTVNGAFTLTVGSGLVDGPQSTQIFAGTSSIAGMNYTRPEWFGAANTSAAFLAAYNAVIANGKILLLPSTYVSPFNTGQGSNVVTKTVLIEGTALGQLDSETAPTEYASGTIIDGEFDVETGITLENLAIDNGSAYDTTGCGSPAPSNGNGLFIARNHAVSGFIFGTHIHHVGVLTCGTHLDGRHTVLFENNYAPDVNDFTATTTGGDYGIIIKSQYGSFSNLHVKGATQSAIYCKSDFAGFQDGNCQNNRIDGYWVDDLATVGDTVGPLIDSQSDNVFGNTWMNGHFTGLQLGFRFIGGTPNTTSAEKIIGLTGINMQNACVYTNVGALVSNLQISGVSCEVNNATPGSTGFTFNTGTSLVNLSDITVSSSASSTIDGIDDQTNSGSINVNGATCFGYTGICVITTNSASTPMLATHITAISPVGASNGQIFEQHNNPIQISADMFWAGSNWRCQSAPCTLWSVRDGANNVQASLLDGGTFFSSSLITSLATPASSSAACTAGRWSADANFVYVCTATNTWKRVALTTF